MNDYNYDWHAEKRMERVKNKSRYRVTLVSSYDLEVSYGSLIKMLGLNAYKCPKWRSLPKENKERVLNWISSYNNREELDEKRHISLSQVKDRQGNFINDDEPFAKKVDKDDVLEDALRIEFDGDDIKTNEDNRYHVLAGFFRSFLIDFLDISDGGNITITHKMVERLVRVLVKQRNFKIQEFKRLTKAGYNHKTRLEKDFYHYFKDEKLDKHVPWSIRVSLLHEWCQEKKQLCDVITSSEYYEEHNEDVLQDDYLNIPLPRGEEGILMIMNFIENNSQYHYLEDFYNITHKPNSNWRNAGHIKGSHDDTVASTL